MVIGAIVIVNVTIFNLHVDSISGNFSLAEIAGIISLIFSGTVIVVAFAAFILGGLSRKMRISMKEYYARIITKEKDALNTYHHVWSSVFRILGAIRIPVNYNFIFCMKRKRDSIVYVDQVKHKWWPFSTHMRRKATIAEWACNVNLGSYIVSGDRELRRRKSDKCKRTLCRKTYAAQRSFNLCYSCIIPGILQESCRESAGGWFARTDQNGRSVQIHTLTFDSRLSQHRSESERKLNRSEHLFRSSCQVSRPILTIHAMRRQARAELFFIFFAVIYPNFERSTRNVVGRAV